jgi:glutathione synthase/RimK-type ligase-like ATP-grasp enzyme
VSELATRVAPRSTTSQSDRRVLILAQPQDEHAVAVAAELEALGASSTVLDLSLIPESVSLTIRFDCCGKGREFAFDTGAERLDVAQYGSVWWRRPQQPGVSSAMTRPGHRLFAINETQEALVGLWHSLDASWINEPSADDRAHRKPYQLRVAQDMGLAIPSTVMTSDPFEARRFADSRGFRSVVYKSFSATESEWRETRLLRSEELGLLDQVRHAPVIFQEYIDAVYDLRITVVGDDVFPAAIWSQQTDYIVDSRIDIANAKVEPVAIPADLEELLRAYVRRLGLVFGAIDMRLTPEGQYVFLEINPAGQFMYIQVQTNQPIASAVARALVNGG